MYDLKTEQLDKMNLGYYNEEIYQIINLEQSKLVIIIKNQGYIKHEIFYWEYGGNKIEYFKMIIRQYYFSCFELRKDEFMIAYGYYPGILAKFKIIRDDNNNNIITFEIVQRMGVRGQFQELIYYKDDIIYSLQYR